MLLPLFDYGDVVWSSCSNTLQDRLQRLHNRAGKLILKCPFRTASVEVKQQLKWTSVRERQHFPINGMTYKCLNNLVPPYLQNIFTPITNIHNHNTRLRASVGMYVNPNTTKAGTNKFSHRGTKLWNTLPDSVKLSPSIKHFKQNYWQHYWLTHD